MSHSCIQKFGSNGAFLLKWGSAGTGDGEFSYPAGIAFDSNGYVYVTDQGDDVNRVQIFSSSGVFLGAWGTTGSSAGEFNFPTGIAIAPGGEVYIADTLNHRIQKFGPAVTPALPTSWGKLKANYRQ